MGEITAEEVTAAEIRREESGSGGRYVLSAGGAEAEMTYSRISAKRIIVDHTGVPAAMRGTGAGLRLAEHAVADARENGWSILPLCPFMRAQALRHEAWHDVVEMR